MHLVLASQSPARLQVLRNAGVTPLVHVSHVDEDALTEAMPHATPEELCLALAQAKAEAVAPHYQGQDVIVVGCDSVFDLDGVAYGKPHNADVAKERWRLMMGRSGTLRTGHWLIDARTGASCGAVAHTHVHMGTLTEREMDAYLARASPSTLRADSHWMLSAAHSSTASTAIPPMWWASPCQRCAGSSREWV